MTERKERGEGEVVREEGETERGSARGERKRDLFFCFLSSKEKTGQEKHLIFCCGASPAGPESPRVGVVQFFLLLLRAPNKLKSLKEGSEKSEFTHKEKTRDLSPLYHCSHIFLSSSSSSYDPLQLPRVCQRLRDQLGPRSGHRRSTGISSSSAAALFRLALNAVAREKHPPATHVPPAPFRDRC